MDHPVLRPRPRRAARDDASPAARDIPARGKPIPPDVQFVIRPADAAEPGELGIYRIFGNFLLTRHRNGGNVSLTAEEIVRYSQMLSLSSVEGRCKRCGNPLAYPGALFCGAACSARYEAGD